MNSRSSRVIFNLKTAPKVPNIRFESDNVQIYIYESDSSEHLNIPVIPIIDTNINNGPISMKRKSKYTILAKINQTNIRDRDIVRRIGLKLPPIIVGDARLDLGIIDFLLR
jgi:hypothetical protein